MIGEIKNIFILLVSFSIYIVLEKSIAHDVTEFSNELIPDRTELAYNKRYLGYEQFRLPLNLYAECTGRSVSYSWKSPSGIEYNSQHVSAEESGTWTCTCSTDYCSEEFKYEVQGNKY